MAEIAIPDLPWAEIPHIEVDAMTLAEWLDCDERTVRKYAQMGIAKRTARDRYALFESIGGVVEHFRELASRNGTADTMRANTQLKNAQRRLLDLRYERERAALISLPEIAKAWADLAQVTEWLFTSFPERARFKLPHLMPADHAGLEQLCLTMLGEAAFRGAPQLPTNKT